MGHWPASVLARRSLDGYAVLTLSAAAELVGARGGQYASVRIGGVESSMLMRRALWIREVAAGGRHGAAVELVADLAEPGAAWLASQPESARIDVMAPLGRPFPLPGQASACLLIGFGAASATMLRLAEDLVAGGSRVRFLMLGAGRPFGVVSARRFSAEVVERCGSSRDWAPDVAEHIGDGTEIVYSAGPAADLARVAAALSGTGLPHRCAVETQLVCGSGTCTACAIPIRGRDGVSRMVRACTEGAVFDADLVRWTDLGTVPGDCFGAAQETA